MLTGETLMPVMFSHFAFLALNFLWSLLYTGVEERVEQAEFSWSRLLPGLYPEKPPQLLQGEKGRRDGTWLWGGSRVGALSLDCES